MSTAWMLNAVGLFVTTTGSLLLFLYLCNTAPRAEGAGAAVATPELVQNYRRLRVAVGLLAVWLVIQDLSLILL